MKSTEEIFKKATKHYHEFLKAAAVEKTTSEKAEIPDDAVSEHSEGLFPLRIPLGRSDAGELLKDSSLLNEHSEAGYRVLFKEQNTRRFGEQTLPYAVEFPEPADLLRYLKKVDKYRNFTKDLEFILKEIPVLAGWIAENTSVIISEHGNWSDLMKVCRFFLSNPRPNLYIRELPVAVHTKFVEEKKAVIRKLLDFLIADFIRTEAADFYERFYLKYPEELIRIRILDKKISEKYFSGIPDISLPVSQFAALNIPEIRSALISENLLCFLTIPELPDAVAVFGKGFAVQRLRSAAWLSNLRILYWGDIDIQGFQILSMFRSSFKSVQSLMMDIRTYTEFQQFICEGTPASIQELPHLTEEESAMLQILIQAAPINRLEQERIPQGYANERIKEVLG